MFQVLIRATGSGSRAAGPAFRSLGPRIAPFATTTCLTLLRMGAEGTALEDVHLAAPPANGSSQKEVRSRPFPRNAVRMRPVCNVLFLSTPHDAERSKLGLDRSMQNQALESAARRLGPTHQIAPQLKTCAPCQALGSPMKLAHILSVSVHFQPVCESCERG